MVHLLSATTWLTLSPRLVGRTQTIKQHLHLAFLLHSLDNGAPIDEEDMVWRDLVERLEYKHQSIAEVRARFQEVLPEQDVKFRSMDTLESKGFQVSKDINSSLGFNGFQTQPGRDSEDMVDCDYPDNSDAPKVKEIGEDMQQEIKDGLV